MEKKEYVRVLKEYTKEQGISIYEYYLNYARLLRSNDKFVLQPFEFRNPFFNAESIKKLITNPDPRMAEYYAYTMTQVINSQIEELEREEIESVINEALTSNDLSKEEVRTVINEELEDLSRKEIEEEINERLNHQPTYKVVMTSISRKLADTLNGFTVVREEKTGRAHLYYHDAKKNMLENEQVYLNNSFNSETGYYINFQEYVDLLLDEIVSKYPNPEEISFIRDDGEKRTLNELLEEAYAILNQHGALRYGKDVVGKRYKSYKELRQETPYQEEEYYGKPLKTGVYVRRDILTRIMAKYKAKVTLIQEEQKEATK